MARDVIRLVTSIRCLDGLPRGCPPIYGSLGGASPPEAKRLPEECPEDQAQEEAHP